MTAQTLLTRMPELIDPDAVGETQAVVQYHVSTPVHHIFADGTLRVVWGLAESPDLSVTVSDEDLLELFRGTLNPAVALMSGRVKVTGDLDLAQRLLGFVDPAKLKA